PGQFTSLAAGTFGNGHAEVFGISIDQQAYFARFSAAGAFTDGWILVAPGQFTVLAAAGHTNGTLELLGVGRDGQAYAANLNAAGSLANGWFPANTNQPVGFLELTATTLGNGNAVAFALGSDQLAYEATFAADTGVKVSGWTPVASDLFRKLTAGKQGG